MSFSGPFSSGFNLGSSTARSSETSRRLRRFYKKSNQTARELPLPPGFERVTHDDFVSHVLVVDDDQFSRTLVGAPLIAANSRVTFADSNSAAVEELMTKKFDLVILDWVLVEATGFDVLKKAEELMSHKLGSEKLPFVVYSSCNITDIRLPELKYFDYKGHWLKPFNIKNLKDKIIKLKNK